MVRQELLLLYLESVTGINGKNSSKLRILAESSEAQQIELSSGAKDAGLVECTLGASIGLHDLERYCLMFLLR